MSTYNTNIAINGNVGILGVKQANIIVEKGMAPLTVGNYDDWEFTFPQENKIMFSCSRKYSDGLYTISYTIDGNKKAIETKVTINEKTIKIIEKKFNGIISGEVGLSTGNILDRYCYFRSSSLVEFLRKNGITAIENGIPEKIIVDNAFCGAGSKSYAIVTDGDLSRIDFTQEDWVKDYDGISCDDSQSTFQLNNATFCIVAKHYHYKDTHNDATILYVPKGGKLPLISDEIKERLKKLTSNGCSFIYSNYSTSIPLRV